MGPPSSVLYRIGRADPLQWTAWRYVGGSRFDDPLGRYRVLYTGERRACFVESLASFRPGLSEATWSGSVPPEWFSTRRIARFSLSDPTWRAIDLRAAETLHAFRAERQGFLIGKGYDDFDMSDALGHDLDLTQTISAWAYDRGFGGIVYASRLALDLACVAIFETVTFVDAKVTEIERFDPDLIWAASVLGLALPT